VQAVEIARTREEIDSVELYDGLHLPAEAAAVQLTEQRTVAAADLERIDWMPARPQARVRAEREHVVGLSDCAERAPARIAGGVGGGLGIALVVEPDELFGVLHRAIIRSLA
jgi:hypothetical protein